MPLRIEYGAMLEVPALAEVLDQLLPRVDFLSIGTNDLIQYTLAVDRSDESVSHLYDPLHPAIIKLLALAIGAANKSKIPIAVCGEMAGEVSMTRLLLGLGLRDFSMHPAHVPTIKQRVLGSDVAATKPLIERIKRTDVPAKLAALIDKLNA
jgi:phosphotransferase system enzyme I (PtsI)